MGTLQEHIEVVYFYAEFSLVIFTNNLHIENIEEQGKSFSL